MTRARPLDATLAALATAAAVLPLTSLLRPWSFLLPVLLGVGVIALSGVVLRALTASVPLVVVGQAVAFVLSTSWVHGRGHLWHGLPSPEMAQVFTSLLRQAALLVQAYAAPAPAGRAITLGVVVITGLLALVVDVLAVTSRSPAVAGVPLLTAYLLSAANQAHGLALGYFVLAAGAWLMLLARQGTRTIRRWGPLARLDRPERYADERIEAFRTASSARRLALVAVVAACALPLVLPHLPPRYLMAGLGRSTDGSGAGGVSLTTTVDITRDLVSQSTATVLTYRTTANAPDPLRVNILGAYDNGQWSVLGGAAAPLPSTPEGLTDNVVTQTFRVRVSDNHLVRDQLATPTPVISVDLGRTPWTADPNGSIRPSGQVSSYTVDYLRADPTEQQLEGAGLAPSLPADRSTLTIPAADAGLLSATNARLLPRGATPIQAARDIQAWLRGPSFTYSLTLATPPRVDGRRLRPGLESFLATRQGYCVQFATAMVLLARAAGIPARFASGYLPGHLGNDGTWTVRGADAHAWAELWFEGIGWLRFDATPGAHSTVPPAWSVAPVEPAVTPTGPVSSATPTTPRNKPRQLLETTAGAPAGASLPARAWYALAHPDGTVLSLLLVLVGGFGALALPAAARARRRRILASAVGDARRVEAQWQELIRRLEDLGVSPPIGATPRQAGRYITTSTHLSGEDAAAMSTVVGTLERARYAAPGRVGHDVSAQTAQVRFAVARTRIRRTRARAFFLPRDGFAEIRDATARLTSAPRQAWHRLTDLRGRPPDRSG